MNIVTMPLEDFSDDAVAQLTYALSFLGEDAESHEVRTIDRTLVITLRAGADHEAVLEKARALLERYRGGDVAFRSTVYFEQHASLVPNDTWEELQRRRLVTAVGDGHVILRGQAAQLAELVDRKVDHLFARPFQAEREIYPATIKCETLDRCNHFTSFPEHLDFVAHLRPDVEVLKAFTDDCRVGGWKPEYNHNRMSEQRYAISPSCCYHCYEGMEGWALEGDGRCVTTTVNCHRFEGRNQTSLSRLRSFTMREVIWVGTPKYVLAARHRADDVIVGWARDWGMACTYETANDMFFTDDYAVKASFQRQQEAKRELRMVIPQEGRSISVFSSNFHSNTFGKAFSITANDRPAASACTGWGFERWVYAIYSQFGFDTANWPNGLLRDFSAYLEGPRA